MSSGSGHVFVVRSDLSRLACDDVLIPTDPALHVTGPLWPLLGDELRGERHGSYGWRVRIDPPTGWGRDVRVLPVPGAGRPRRWLVETAREEPAELVAAVEEWLARVTEADDGPARNDRARPLLALPLVGTGKGGAAGHRGDVIGALLPVLERAAGSAGVDVALVLRDGRDFSACQEVRRRIATRWPLDAELLAVADELAERARRGDLALFLGAGVSRAAGMPMWDELLDGLGRLAGRDERERELLRRVAPPDAAQLLVEQLGRERFTAEVGRLFNRREYALAHALLAGLPVSYAVTTNYDPLFESAAEGAGRDVRVLPGGSRVLAEPWLVKLHGDAAQPESVVLTRESYLRLTEDQAALTGVVQALLLTRHMLFVGFSLLDDTFIRIAHQVRQVLARAASAETGEGTVGTALSLVEEPLRRELWQRDLTFVAMAPARSELAEAARLLEVFLDRVAASAASRTGWLLDERYAALRTDEDAALARAVAGLVDHLPSAAAQSAGWPVLAAALTALGREDPTG